jgi:hypothetical protein
MALPLRSSGYPPTFLQPMGSHMFRARVCRGNVARDVKICFSFGHPALLLCVKLQVANELFDEDPAECAFEKRMKMRHNLAKTGRPSRRLEPSWDPSWGSWWRCWGSSAEVMCHMDHSPQHKGLGPGISHLGKCLVPMYCFSLFCANI